MAVPNNPEVCRVSLIYARDTRTFVNVLHFRQLGGWVDTDLPGLCAEVADWWNDSYRLVVPPEVALVQVQARVYDPALPLAFDLPISPPNPGTNATGDPTSANVTSTLSWRTGLAGRKYRGRIYCPSLPELSVGDDDRLTSPTVSGLAVAAGDLIARAVTLAVDLVIFHRVDNTFTKVISYVIENIVDSQRRRLPARGR